MLLYYLIMDVFQFSKLHPKLSFNKAKFRKFYQYNTLSFSPHIFPNQFQFGQDIANTFLDRSVHTILAVAPTQSGKTGSMLATIQHVLAQPTLSLPIQHIFIITGHSSTEWTKQTMQRFPPEFRDNIFHRNQLSYFVDKVKDLSNVLIFVDESHIASRKHQSVQAALSNAGIFPNLYEKDIKIVLVTATPALCIKNYTFQATVSMKTPLDYRSIDSLILDGLVLTAKDLSLPSSIPHILELASFISGPPKYHIIRTPRGDGFQSTIDNFILVFGVAHFDFIDDATDFDFLSFPPSTHTFIFIIDRLRCATTIDKSHLGVLYERSPKIINYDTIVQGLLGRATGFHSSSPIVFTHI